MTERTLQCDIEDVAKWHPWLYLEPHIVSCAAVLAPYGKSPATFEVECADVDSDCLDGDARFRLEVRWSRQVAEKAVRLRSTVQTKPLVEMASTALALALCHRLLRLGQLDVTCYGERTDFRSTALSRMLEVSGTESIDELGRRHRDKVAQALANPLGWDSYVVVCGFSDRGHRIRLSFHRKGSD